MATKLFIPGPTEVAPEVLAAMSGPMMGHRSKAASALQRRISDNLRRILLTEQEILLLSARGYTVEEIAKQICKSVNTSKPPNGIYSNALKQNPS